MSIASSPPHSPSPMDRRNLPELRSMTQLLEVLAQHCQQGQTGNLYFVSADQHAGSFTLRVGEIIAIRYACRQGVGALRSLQRVIQIQQLQGLIESPWCSYRFTVKRVSISEDASLPRTPSILRQLGWSLALPSSRSAASQTNTSSLPIPDRSSASASETVTPGVLASGFANSSSRLLSTEEQALVIQHLTHYLGPAARLVANKAFRQTQELMPLVTLLAAKIPDSRDAYEFQVRLRSAIQL